MGISRECLDRVLKTSSTDEIIVRETKIKSQSVLATVVFNKNQINIDFHVWKGFAVSNHKLFLWGKEVYEQYRILKAQREELERDRGLVKQMAQIQEYIEAIESNYWTFEDFLAKRKVKAPTSKEQINNFAKNNQEICEDFLRELSDIQLFVSGEISA